MEDVEYWGKDEGLMRTLDCNDMYPPRITLEIVPKTEHQDMEAIFYFNIFEHRALLITREGMFFLRKMHISMPDLLYGHPDFHNPDPPTNTTIRRNWIREGETLILFRIALHVVTSGL